MEELFEHIAHVAATAIEAAAVFIVFFGSVEAFVKLLPVMARPRASHGQRKPSGGGTARGCCSVSSSSWRPTLSAA
jgi:hypothetical protein